MTTRGATNTNARDTDSSSECLRTNTNSDELFLLSDINLIRTILALEILCERNMLIRDDGGDDQWASE